MFQPCARDVFVMETKVQWRKSWKQRGLCATVHSTADGPLICRKPVHIPPGSPMVAGITWVL